MKAQVHWLSSRQLIGLFCLLCLAIPWPVAADGVLIKVESPPQSIAQGGTATVNVQLSGSSPVYGVELHLTFDPTIAEVIDEDGAKSGVQVQAGTLFAGKQTFTAANAADNAAGKIDYAVTMVGEPHGVTEGGTVIVIRFRGRAPGTSPIAIAEALVGDPVARTVEVSTENGRVTVVAGGEEAYPLPTSSGWTSSTPVRTAIRPSVQRTPTRQAAPTRTGAAKPGATQAPGAYPASPATRSSQAPAAPSGSGKSPASAATATSATGASATVAPGASAGPQPSAHSRLPIVGLAVGALVAVGAAAGLYLWSRRGRSGAI